MATSESLEADALRHYRAGELDAALAKAERAALHSTALRPAHGLQVLLLRQQGRLRDAEAALTVALALPASSAQAADGLAYAAMALGRHADANRMYRATVTLQPRDAGFWYNLASSERSFGRLTEAEEACERAIALDAAQYPSYLLRSELKVQSPESNHVRQLQTLLAKPAIERRAHMFLAYALGKELDDLGRYDEAFHWFSAGARARREALSYNVEVDEAKIQRITEVFTGDAVRPPEPVADSSRFIFVVGLPRSGTTLIERILTGLPGVRSNGETDNFSQALIKATAPGPGDLFARASAADASEVARRYQALADPGVCGAKVLEKLPMNYLYLGAMVRALAGVHLISVRRSPLDSCFAMYRTLFGVAYPFSYDLEEIARYYAAYSRLMAHWRRVLGDALHEISYEDVVADPAAQGIRLARWSGLEWTPAAVQVEDNAAVSWTASASQIRRPIYGSSSGKWRHYRKQFAPLMSALRKQGVELPPDAG